LIKRIITTLKKRKFTFEVLVSRDFKQKYKGTILGAGWSILSPLLHLLVMRLVFTQFFGRNMEHYTTYLFAGNLMFSYFREATTGGMSALMDNRGIFTKINVPKYIFLLTKNVSSIINFGLTLLVFFLFVWIDGVAFTWKFLLLVYPIMCMMVFNIGMGLILSALYVFFRDVKYLYDVCTQLLMYTCAIFYTVDSFSPMIQKIFLINPVYCAIKYVRLIILHSSIPSLQFHLLLGFYALAALVIGGWIYKKKNHEFLYYV